MVIKMKEKINKFSQGIKLASFPPESEFIVRTTFINIADLLGESKTLIELFVHLLLVCSAETRKWVLYSEGQDFDQEEYLILNDRSLKYRI